MVGQAIIILFAKGSSRRQIEMKCHTGISSLSSRPTTQSLIHVKLEVRTACFLFAPFFSTILPSPYQPCCCSNGTRLSLPNYVTLTMDRESGATEEVRVSRNMWFHFRRHRYCYASHLHTRIRALMLFAFKLNHILVKLALNAPRLDSQILQPATGAVVHQHSNSRTARSQQPAMTPLP